MRAPSGSFPRRKSFSMAQTITQPAKDRRGAPRSPISLTAYLITPSGRQLRGVARNLSRSGVFVETRLPPEWLVGETARLVFALTEGNVVRLAHYSVLIVRESPRGLGLAFWRSMRPARTRSRR
ncbi:PilZ domain-containing protein [Candidatus Methylocalor cossyra]|uniref:PilZ domain-containing protein n=1 Tax=Candidatus Methylocalor cossyra TaxID=3108543 RepID=A0ABP1CBW1_9GAMM